MSDRCHPRFHRRLVLTLEHERSGFRDDAETKRFAHLHVLLYYRVRLQLHTAFAFAITLRIQCSREYGHSKATSAQTTAREYRTCFAK
jgi:hypothetical protein